MVLKMRKYMLPRYNITYKKFIELEKESILIRHIERYAYIRQWLSGRILDAGCGTGYGSYMIVMNPDVDFVLGIDNDKNAISIAKREFKIENLKFICTEFTKIKKERFDWMIAVEIIEHLSNPETLAELADRLEVNKILLTYPSKKTTHYNPYHFKDYTDEIVMKVFTKFRIYNTYDFHATHDTRVLFLRRINE